MFHRVKSETQTNESNNTATQTQQSAEVKEFKRPQAEEAKQEEAEVETQTQDEPETNTEETSTITNPQKEAESMSQDTQPANRKETTQEDNIPASIYQRAGTAPVRAAGGYPGAYPGYAATPAAGQQEARGDRRLTIGAGITMSGEIESCDYLLVEGTVEAALKGASVLDIAESGVFYGTVEIEDATIAGRFEGDITAHGRLTLREGATVTGSIAYKELEIEAGAIIDGKLTPLQGVQAAEKKPKGSAQPKKALNESGKQSPANSDGELFSKAAAAAE